MSHPTEATPLLTASPACPLNATQDVAPFRRLSILRPFRGEPPENIPFRYQSFRQNLMALGFLQFNFCLIIFCALAAIGNPTQIVIHLLRNLNHFQWITVFAEINAHPEINAH